MRVNSVFAEVNKGVYMVSVWKSIRSDWDA